MMLGKIGVGIVTCNRESFLEKCIDSIPEIDVRILINDGKTFSNSINLSKFDLVIHHKKSIGVGKSKNEIIRFLMDQSCEHIFLIEDDVVIIKPNVFEHYINTAVRTGIYHLNFAFHGDGNKDRTGKPVSRKLIYENGEEILSLNKNLLGAFSYYNKSLIEKSGLMDERYINGLEHIDHTYQIIKDGLHPPFWWFADAPSSYKFIFDQDADHSKSIIRKNKILWMLNMKRNLYFFRKKHGLSPFSIPDTSEEKVINELEDIKRNRSIRKIS